MALLEIGCRDGWLLPSIEVLASRARTLGDALRNSDDPAALAFEGYTLVGACWHSPNDLWQAYAMPVHRGQGLQEKLRQLISEARISRSGVA
jgi:hypothetical protein